LNQDVDISFLGAFRVKQRHIKSLDAFPEAFRRFEKVVSTEKTDKIELSPH
jgi:hypothetical protein